MGFAAIRFEAGEGGEEGKRPFEVSELEITSPHYKIKWNPSGQLVSIYDVDEEREVLAGGRGNIFQIFEDKPLRGKDAWGIDAFYQEKREEVDHLEKVEVTEKGPLRAVVRFAWRYKESVIEQDLILYAKSRRIDFITRIDWQERQKLLKAAFPVEVRNTEATYDIKGNVMRLTLLKCAVFPDPEADRGEHRFTYSLLPHAGDWIHGATVIEAWQLNNPLRYVAGSFERSSFSIFRLEAARGESPAVLIDAVKKAEHGEALVLRLHEYSGGRGSVQIESDLPIRSCQECDLLERRHGKRSTEGTIRFEVKPYEIKSFLIDF